MGILSGIFRRDPKAQQDTKAAMKLARRQKADAPAGAASASTGKSGNPVTKLVESFRDIGLNGKAGYASAETVARKAAGRNASARRQEKAIRKVVASHRRGITAAGFVTGLGGLFTLPVLLPANIFEFYVQATRMSGAIASIRGYDVKDEEVRARVLATLVGDDAGNVLDGLGLGPVAGAAGREVSKRITATPTGAVASAIGSRIVRRFTLRSARLFGKAIPGAGAIIGAMMDRRLLAKIAEAAKREFPPQA